MDGEKVVALCFLLVSLFHPSEGQDERNVTAEAGQDRVLLPCSVDETRPVVAVRWTRTDVGGAYVLLLRDGQLDADLQHAAFRNRAAPSAGGALALSNVTAGDAGTYQCHVSQREADGTNSRMEVTSTVHLLVAPPAPPGNQEGSREGGSRHQHLGLIPAAILLLVVGSTVLVLLYRNQDGGEVGSGFWDRLLQVFT